MKNIWILTEERPKNEVIKTILEKLALDNDFGIKSSGMSVVPIMRDGRFVFIYKVEGVQCEGYKNVLIKLASGDSSFVDFLVFLQEAEPDNNSKPFYAIEETKTDDSESRNTGVYQRCSKFVYIEFYYPGIKKIMLYNLQISQKKEPTDTSIFGTRMLRTIGVEILGKVHDKEILKPFSSLKELVDLKNSMRMPPKGNVPIKIEINKDSIKVSGRLYKAGGINHDPNIGALTIIALCIRKWEKKKDIIITKHGLKQSNLGKSSKFIQIANKVGIKLDGLKMPIAVRHENYWHYDMSQEKVASVFLHVALVAYTKARVIYANHGGSERGYFTDPKLGAMAIEKYQEGKRAKYKAGDKTMIIHIPDMIIYDLARKEIINVEGKKYSTRKQGIEDLKNYTYIEKKKIIPAYNPASIVRTVVIFGSKEKMIKKKQIGFMLNENGEVILGKQAPQIFKDVVKKLLTL
ncbi:MAG: hypothetical protein NTV24_05310 [Candidatus Woesebacteria bacterium]|nr:hypothetical protein [Candidatus Woesebacteria bacterium]